MDAHVTGGMPSLSDVTLLVILGDEPLREFVVRSLAMRAKTVWSAASAEEGIAAFSAHRPDIVICDMQLGTLSGPHAVRYIRAIDPFAQIIFVSDTQTVAHLAEAIDVGVNAFLPKPLNLRRLFEAVEKCSIAARKARQLEKTQEQIRTILDFQDDMILVTDGNRIMTANKSFFRYFRLLTLDDFQERYGRLGGIFIAGRGFLGDLVEQPWIDQLLDSPYEKHKVKIRNPLSGGDNVFLVKLTRYPGQEGQYIVALTNISELEHERSQIEWQASHDPLTQVYNRMRFMAILEEEVVRFDRYHAPFCLIMFDIDHFKTVNDTFGHICGDNVLLTLTGLVAASIRQNDTFARWGGEEFMILAPETLLESGIALAEKLRSAVDGYPFEEVGHITTSFGVVEIRPGENVTLLLSRADDALYRAKREGRNKVAADA